MILRVAWRNIWRNKLRSGVVILAISVGLWAGVFASAFVNGMMDQKMQSVIAMEMSHFQFHHPEFRDELITKYTLKDSEKIVQELTKDASVKNISQRVIATPMMQSPRFSGSMKITGISADAEAKVTTVHKYVKEGVYLDSEKRNKILISSKTAEKYTLKLRSNVILQLQNTDGEIEAGAFTVTGIYETGNPMYDEMNAFVRTEDLQKLLGIGDQMHEIAVLLNEHDIADPLSEKYQENYPEAEVLSWKDLSPGMRIMVEAMGMYTIIIVAIIMIALLFSIVNTMLMAVLERVREIGMLMAIGMSKWRVFAMVMIETIFLSLIGGAVGLLLSWGSIVYFGTNGIDLGGAAYADMGFANIVYPTLDLKSYIDVTIMVIIMAVLGAMYPARKALKLKPVEAIRKI